jgi:trimethylamine---corrinoid protein Co-methyltransferase
LAGANLIYGLGMLESGITFDFGQLVLDNEFARMIKATVGGIAVNDDTLAVDTIHEIGAFDDFLSHDTTFAHMRSQSRAELLDRRTHEEWRQDGATDAAQRGIEKARWILENHHPEPLSDDVLTRMRAIIAETEKELGIAAKPES